MTFLQMEKIPNSNRFYFTLKWNDKIERTKSFNINNKARQRQTNANILEMIYSSSHVEKLNQNIFWYIYNIFSLFIIFMCQKKELNGNPVNPKSESVQAYSLCPKHLQNRFNDILNCYKYLHCTEVNLHFMQLKTIYIVLPNNKKY